MPDKILCLINAAPYSRPYFEQLAPYLEARNYSIAFALDSHLTDVIYANDRAITGAYYFSDFARAWLDKPSALSTDHTWGSMFSDFDRFLTMEIKPPLDRNGPLQYSQVPALLEQFFGHVFAVEKPKAVLYEAASNCFALAAYRQARIAGIPFCSVFPSRISGRIDVSLTGGIEDHIAVGNTFRAAREGAISPESYRIAADYIRDIDTQVPDYMKPKGAGHAIGQMSLTRKYLRAEKFRIVKANWHYRTRYRKDCELGLQHGDPIKLSIAYFKRALLRRLRFQFIQRFYQTEVLDEPFVLYPLHFHPEASTSVLAADFIDELSLIKSIAFRLPTSVKLYVKEHPSAIALQPRSFYRQLNAMPNVRLLSAGLPAKQLIRRSRGVICLTSTLGFEAAVLNKPVIAMGDVLYGYYPNVRMIREHNALDAALEWALNYQPVPPEQLLDATAAYVEFGGPGSFDFNGSLGDAAALTSVADELVKRLRK